MKFITKIENYVNFFIDQVVHILEIHRLIIDKFGAIIIDKFSNKINNLFPFINLTSQYTYKRIFLSRKKTNAYKRGTEIF